MSLYGTESKVYADRLEGYCGVSILSDSGSSSIKKYFDATPFALHLKLEAKHRVKHREPDSKL